MLGIKWDLSEVVDDSLTERWWVINEINVITTIFKAKIMSLFHSFPGWGTKYAAGMWEVTLVLRNRSAGVDPSQQSWCPGDRACRRWPFLDNNRVPTARQNLPDVSLHLSVGGSAEGEQAWNTDFPVQQKISPSRLSPWTLFSFLPPSCSH